MSIFQEVVEEFKAEDEVIIQGSDWDDGLIIQAACAFCGQGDFFHGMDAEGFIEQINQDFAAHFEGCEDYQRDLKEHEDYRLELINAYY